MPPFSPSHMTTTTPQSEAKEEMEGEAKAVLRPPFKIRNSEMSTERGLCVGLSGFFDPLDEALEALRGIEASSTPYPDDELSSPPSSSSTKTQPSWRTSEQRERVELETRFTALFYKNTGGDRYEEIDDWTRSRVMCATKALISLIREAGVGRRQPTRLVPLLKCLRNLTRTAAKTELLERGACELCTRLMVMYEENALVCEWCLRCCANLLINESETERIAQLERFLALDLPTLAIEAITRHGLASMKLGEIACYTLYLCALDREDVRLTIHRAETVPHLRDVMLRHVASAALCEAVLRLLCCLVGGFADLPPQDINSPAEVAYRQSLIVAGIVPAILRAMRNHGETEEDVASLGVCVLVNVVRGGADFNDAFLTHVAAARPEHEIVTAMRKHAKTNYEMTQQGALLIFALARGPFSRARDDLLCLRADEVLINCMRLYDADDRMVEIALAALGCLIQNMEAAKMHRAVTHLHVVELLDRVLVLHSDGTPKPPPREPPREGAPPFDPDDDYGIGELTSFIVFSVVQIPSCRLALLKHGAVGLFEKLLRPWHKRSNLTLTTTLGSLCDLHYAHAMHTARLEVEIRKHERGETSPTSQSSRGKWSVRNLPAREQEEEEARAEMETELDDEEDDERELQRALLDTGEEVRAEEGNDEGEEEEEEAAMGGVVRHRPLNNVEHHFRTRLHVQRNETERRAMIASATSAKAAIEAKRAELEQARSWWPLQARAAIVREAGEISMTFRPGGPVTTLDHGENVRTIQNRDDDDDQLEEEAGTEPREENRPHEREEQNEWRDEEGVDPTDRDTYFAAQSVLRIVQFQVWALGTVSTRGNEEVEGSDCMKNGAEPGYLTWWGEDANGEILAVAETAAGLLSSKTEAHLTLRNQSGTIERVVTTHEGDAERASSRGPIVKVVCASFSSRGTDLIALTEDWRVFSTAAPIFGSVEDPVLVFRFHAGPPDRPSLPHSIRFLGDVDVGEARAAVVVSRPLLPNSHISSNKMQVRAYVNWTRVSLGPELPSWVASFSFGLVGSTSDAPNESSRVFVVAATPVRVLTSPLQRHVNGETPMFDEEAEENLHSSSHHDAFGDTVLAEISLTAEGEDAESLEAREETSPRVVMCKRPLGRLHHASRECAVVSGGTRAVLLHAKFDVERDGGVGTDPEEVERMLAARQQHLIAGGREPMEDWEIREEGEELEGEGVVAPRTRAANRLMRRVEAQQRHASTGATSQELDIRGASYAWDSAHFRLSIWRLSHDHRRSPHVLLACVVVSAYVPPGRYAWNPLYVRGEDFPSPSLAVSRFGNRVGLLLQNDAELPIFPPPPPADGSTASLRVPRKGKNGATIVYASFEGDMVPKDPDDPTRIRLTPLSETRTIRLSEEDITSRSRLGTIERNLVFSEDETYLMIREERLGVKEGEAREEGNRRFRRVAMVDLRRTQRTLILALAGVKKIAKRDVLSTVGSFLM